MVFRGRNDILVIGIKINGKGGCLGILRNSKILKVMVFHQHFSISPVKLLRKNWLMSDFKTTPDANKQCLLLDRHQALGYSLCPVTKHLIQNLKH